MAFRPKIFKDVGKELLRKASIRLPPDVKKALKSAYREERSELARLQLKTILDNIDLAEKLGRPLCQDTGLISFFLKSREALNFKEIQDSLRSATAEATVNIPLRPNAVHPLSRKNTGNNLGAHIPDIQWLFEDEDYIELTAVLKGTGAENMSALAILPPSGGVEGIKRFVVESVVRAGGKPCPPVILCVGVGGTVDLTFRLAKLALLRPLGERNREKDIAKLEGELLKLVNETGIGPMGLGGRSTALDVKIEYAHCHTGSLPVGVNFECWADRRAAARIYPDRSVEYLD